VSVLRARRRKAESKKRFFEKKFLVVPGV